MTRRYTLSGLLLLVALALLSGCAGKGVKPNELPPEFSYAFVVDGRVARTIAAPAVSDRIAAVVQPRNGESAMWQNYGASYAYVVLNPRVRATTPTGGVTMELRGEIQYFRDMKYAQDGGNDEVLRGKPMKVVDLERQTITVEPGTPALADLAEGVAVQITALPKPAPEAASAAPKS